MNNYHISHYVDVERCSSRFFLYQSRLTESRRNVDNTSMLENNLASNNYSIFIVQDCQKMFQVFDPKTKSWSFATRETLVARDGADVTLVPRYWFEWLRRIEAMNNWTCYFSEKAQWALLESGGPPRGARGPLNWSLSFVRVSHKILLLGNFHFPTQKNLPPKNLLVPAKYTFDNWYKFTMWESFWPSVASSSDNKIPLFF